MEYYIVLLVFYAITLIFLRLVFAEIEGRQARKMSNVRYFLRYHSKFVYRNQFSIIFVAFLCYMIVSVEKAFSTMWFLQLLGFIAVGVISDALSQIVYYYYINFRFKKDIVESEELKNEIMLTFLRTQNLIISSYFNTAFNKISTLEDVEKYRRKLYNFKDYLGSTDGYTFYHDYYVEQMAKLEHKYNILENGGNETALDVKNRKENLFISLLKKIKDLFIKKDTNMQESK